MSVSPSDPTPRRRALLPPIRSRTWNTIPASVKDADGYWYGDYYGALAFEVNMDVVKTPPLDWADLTDAAYKGQIALCGDPRISNQAIMSVAAAAVANGGSFENAKPGRRFLLQAERGRQFRSPHRGPAQSLRGKPPS